MKFREINKSIIKQPGLDFNKRKKNRKRTRGKIKKRSIDENSLRSTSFLGFSHLIYRGRFIVSYLDWYSCTLEFSNSYLTESAPSIPKAIN